MVEFDENLNPIQGGQSEEPRPEGIPLGPTPPPIEPPQPVADSEHGRGEPPFEPTPPPVDDFVATPPSPPIEPIPEPQPVADAPVNRPPRGGSVVLPVLVFFGILAIAGIAIVAFVTDSDSSSVVVSAERPEGLTVTATGTVDAIPDVSKLTFGITHKASTVAKVEDEIDSVMDNILGRSLFY